MACDDSQSNCNEHSTAAINLFVPILLVCVLFGVGTSVIFRKLGLFPGDRRPAANGFMFAQNDSLGDDGPNFGEIPKIYDFSMKRNYAGEEHDHWMSLLPISAYHIEDPSSQKLANQSAVTTPPARLSTPPLRFRWFWKPKEPEAPPQDQTTTDQTTNLPPAPVSTSVIIAMPTSSHVLPAGESECLPDIALGVTEVHVRPSIDPPLAKSVSREE